MGNNNRILADVIIDGFSYDSDYKNYPCRCGSKNCVGYIVRSESRWRIKK